MYVVKVLKKQVKKLEKYADVICDRSLNVKTSFFEATKPLSFFFSKKTIISVQQTHKDHKMYI